MASTKAADSTGRGRGRLVSGPEPRGAVRVCEGGSGFLELRCEDLVCRSPRQLEDATGVPRVRRYRDSAGARDGRWFQRGPRRGRSVDALLQPAELGPGHCARCLLGDCFAGAGLAKPCLHDHVVHFSVPHARMNIAAWGLVHTDMLRESAGAGGEQRRARCTVSMTSQRRPESRVNGLLSK